MKKIIFSVAVILTAASLVLVSCHKDKKTDPAPQTTNKDTVFIYNLCGGTKSTQETITFSLYDTTGTFLKKWSTDLTNDSVYTCSSSSIPVSIKIPGIPKSGKYQYAATVSSGGSTKATLIQTIDITFVSSETLNTKITDRIAININSGGTAF